MGNTLVVAGACVALLGLTGRVARAQSCVGDCDGNGVVAINELILGVNVALGTRDISVCEAMDCQGTGMVPINCLIRAVNNDVIGCPGVTRTPGAEGTPTPTSSTPGTPTPTTSTPGTPTATGSTPGTPTATGGSPQGTPTATGDTPQGTPTPTGDTPGTPTATGSRPPTATATLGSASLTRVRLTYLQVKYDVAKPVLLNNSVPIRFGITADSADPSNPKDAEVIVNFSFVETAPADPAEPRTCSSNGIPLRLVGDAVEHQFAADIYANSECASWVGAGAEAHLGVDFDAGLRESGMPTGIDYPPLVFSPANADAADNQLCRKTLDPSAPAPDRGCVYALQLQPPPTGANGKPLIDVQFDSLKPDSSVAVLWPTAEDPDVPAGSNETDQPSMLVDAVFLLDGRDPYKNQIDANGDGMFDASDLPAELVAADPTIVETLKFGLNDAELAELDDLPSPAVVKYDLVPTSLLAPDAWLPLAIDDPRNPNPDGHVMEIEISELEPGTENSVAHALFIEGDTRAAVSPGGAWADETQFTVRGCLVASFEEAGNSGEEEDPEEMPEGGDVPMGDCRTFKVTLTRAPAPGASGFARAPNPSVNTRSFDMMWGRAIGDEQKAQISGTLRTNNTLDLNGARSDSEGLLALKGYLAINLFRAYAKAGALTALATSSYDLGVDAFGVNLVGSMMAGTELMYEVPLMLAKEFQFPVFSIGFGPVSIGITAGIGGNVGVTPKFVVAAKPGGEASVPSLAMASSNGFLQVVFTPSTALTGNVTGGLDLVLAKASLVAMLQVVQIGFPVTAEMRWGVTDLDMATQMVRKLTVLGTLKWDLMLTWLNFSLDAVGKVGLCPFCVGTTINIFKYQNPGETFNLLTRELAAPVVLEAAGLPTATVGADGTPTPTGDAEMSPTPTGAAEASPTPTSGVEPTAVPTEEPTAELGAGAALASTPTPTPTPTPAAE